MHTEFKFIDSMMYRLLSTFKNIVDKVQRRHKIVNISPSNNDNIVEVTYTQQDTADTQTTQTHSRHTHTHMYKHCQVGIITACDTTPTVL